MAWWWGSCLWMLRSSCRVCPPHSDLVLLLGSIFGICLSVVCVIGFWGLTQEFQVYSVLSFLDIWLSHEIACRTWFFQLNLWQHRWLLCHNQQVDIPLLCHLGFDWVCQYLYEALDPKMHSLMEAHVPKTFVWSDVAWSVLEDNSCICRSG